MLKIVSSHASKICSLALTYLIPNLSCVSPQLLQSVKDMVAVNHKHMNRIEQYTTSYLIFCPTSVSTFYEQQEDI